MAFCYPQDDNQDDAAHRTHGPDFGAKPANRAGRSSWPVQLGLSGWVGGQPGASGLARIHL
jgi:hypothetical protein